MSSRVQIALAVSGFLFFGCNDSQPEPETGGPAGGKADTPEAQGEPSIYAVGNRLSPPSTGDRYIDSVQPVVARNCVTCHGCGDAPCQLKLTSFEAVNRGSNKDDLYAPRALSIDREYDPMHLAYGRVLAQDGSIDYAASEEKWRDLDFYSIIANATDSLLGRVLTEAHDATTSFDQSYELAKNLDGRKFECAGEDSPDAEVMIGRAMPLGLPALEQEGSDEIVSWLEDGAAGPSSEAHLAVAQPANPNAVSDWEDFFNDSQDDERGRLVNRYLYEHLFFANLHLQRSSGEFYRLVRSRTRTGPIDEIVTELAFDLPREDDYFYRLQKNTAVLVAKSHITWKIDSDTMDHWKSLFLDADWSLDDDPHFEPDSDNPFAYFAAIPANIRYRFMIENSKQLVDGMVRGSVCTGSGATFAIRDRFWVWFMDPDSDVSALNEVDGEVTGGPRLGESSWFHINPEEASTPREIDYLAAYREQMQKQHPDGIGIENLWNGDNGDNPNAWLTVLRHAKSATVHTGPIGGQPETIWILDYSNFERLYYNLVVQFKVWSHVAHKFETWKLMSFVRSAGEDLMATLLEPEMREVLRDHETRGWGRVSGFAYPTYGECSGDREDEIGDDCQYPTKVEFPELTGDATEQLDAAYAHLSALAAEHIGGGITLDDPLNGVGASTDIPEDIRSRDELDAAFNALTNVKSDAWQYLPETMLIRVNAGDEQLLFTMLANRIYENHERVYLESLDRFPASDTLSVERGIVGHYPGLFVDLPLSDVGGFLRDLANVQTKDDWARIALSEQVGEGGMVIDRRSPEFWTFLDEVHQAWFKEDSVEAAVLDVSEYMWPQQFDEED